MEKEKPTRFILTSEELTDVIASAVAYGGSPVDAIRRWMDNCKAAAMKRPVPEFATHFADTYTFRGVSTNKPGRIEEIPQ